MTMRTPSLLTLCLGLAACAELRPSPSVVPAPAGDWRQIATADDRERLRDWRDAFVSALKAARAAGHRETIAAEGALLEPDAALPGPAIPNGDYRCRVTKLGAKSDGLLDYVAYPAFTCRIAPDQGGQSLIKLTGSQRYVGLILPGDALRQIFLGTLALGDETRALRYGRDKERDVAGVIERIGPARWRMLMPRPHFESQIDVLELVPIR
jgi:hypothetical protein